jgi:hypothetical protein
MLVMAVTLLLTSLLLPALAQLRENARRVVCSSNLRQTGVAVVMYSDAHNERLPPTYYGRFGGNKQEMMVAHRGPVSNGWEGLGWLYKERYIEAPEIFYCPSHTGSHPYSKYARLYPLYRNRGFLGTPLFMNYHYAGDRDWKKPGRERSLVRDPGLVVSVDGLRTERDYNHEVGVNVLHGDTSVTWREDAVTRRVARMLPAEVSIGYDEDETDYEEIYELIMQGGNSIQP